MGRFLTADTPLSGLKLIERTRIGDSRGCLSRLFCAEELADAGWTKPVAQINHTYTAKQGTVRGMHFQHPPYAEMKLVTCLRGEIWDVAVDVRAGSPTFLKWHAVRLSAANNQAVLIPEGIAHGLQTLTEDVELLYCHSTPYMADAEAGLHPLDLRLGIGWPLPVAELSPRDAGFLMLKMEFEGIWL